MTKTKEMTINGKVYLEKSDTNPNIELDKYIIRTYSAGVFFGEIEKLEGSFGIFKNVRRIWYWDGANSLSDLATIGTVEPNKCKFSCTVEQEILTNVIELIKCTPESIESINGVNEWTKK